MTDRTSRQSLLHAHVHGPSAEQPAICLEGCCHVVLAPRENGREVDTDRSIARGANGTVQAVTAHSTPLSLEQSRNLNWGPVLQASLIRAPATSGLIGKGLA